MMLQQKPIEWRRFERVQLEGDVAKPATSQPSNLPPAAATPKPAHSPAAAAPSLLHEFERVLRENERLRMDLSKLREKLAGNSNGTPDRRKEQRRSPDISILASDHELLAAALMEEEKAETPEARTPAAPKESVAQVVAGYIFDKPTEQQIRLISDALRGRGIPVD
jgi:regulator of replication initiation timing